MRLTTRIRYSLARMLLKAGSLPIVAPGGYIAAHFFQPTFKALVEEGYRKNACFFAAVEAYAFAFPEPPLLVWTDDTDEAEPLPKHPIRQLLKKPNARMGEDLLMLYTITYAAIGGMAYWHLPKSKMGRPANIWPYHAGQIRPHAGGPDWVDYYEFDYQSARPTQLDPEEVIPFHWPSIDPLRPWESQAPLIAAAREIDTDNEATRYVFALLKNDAMPRNVLEMPADSALSDAEHRRMKAQWRERYGGDQRGEIAILEGGAKYVRTSLNMQELAFDALQRMPESRICAAMRVPPIIAGLQVGLDNATYSNYEQALIAWTSKTLTPLWKHFGSQAERGLTPFFGSDVALAYDLRKVQALQENTDNVWKRATEAVRAGWLTINQALKMVGQAEVDGGDVYLWTAATMPQPLDTLGEEPPLPEPIPAPALPSPAETQPALTAALRAMTQTKATRNAAQARLIRLLQKTRRDTAKRMEKAVDAFFAELASTVVARASKGAALLVRVGDGATRWERKDLPGLDDLLEDGDELDLEHVTKKYYAEVISASWDAWNGALGVDVDFDLSDPAVVAAMRQSGSRIRGIMQTTRDEVRGLLQHAASEGWTLDMLVRGDGETPGLRSLIQETYKNRARAIARTEMATAQQIAGVERYDNAGVKNVVVFDGGGEDSDDICTGLNGSVQTLAWARANPLQHPNCVRCFGPSYD